MKKSNLYASTTPERLEVLSKKSEKNGGLSNLTHGRVFESADNQTEGIEKTNERYKQALEDILAITEDTVELEVFTDIVKKALHGDNYTSWQDELNTK